MLSHMMMAAARRGVTTPFAAGVARRFRADSLIDCSKVYVKPDAFGGAGAFAAQAIKAGELVEKGLMRRMDGVCPHKCSYVFTWTNDVTEHSDVFTTGSGCAIFYNTNLEGKQNTVVKRFIEENRFEIYALRDIEKDEELTHLYKGMEWRECFGDLHKARVEYATATSE